MSQHKLTQRSAGRLARQAAYAAEKGKTAALPVGVLTCSWCESPNVTWTRVKGKLEHVGCPMKPEGE